MESDNIEGKKTQADAIQAKNVASQKASRINLDRYNDPEGLSMNKMNFGLWYIENKPKLINILEIFLMGVCGVLWLYSLYGLGYYFFVGKEKDNQMIKELIETDTISHDYIEMIAARDLVIYTPQVLNSSKDKYDFVVQVRNPNKNHWGEFNYYIMVGDEKLESGYSIIYPEESRYFLSLANELPSRPSNMQLVLEGVNWNRIDRHEISDWKEFHDEHIQIDISDVVFVPGSASGLSDKISLNNLEFTANNTSAYSYWNVDFVILLYQRGLIIGVNKYSLQEFMSNESRSIRSSWPGVVGHVDKLEVMPYVNILDKSNYIKPGN